MYLSNLMVRGYRSFDSEFKISFSEGLNVLVGENGAGKSAVIDAARLILMENEYGRSPVLEKDFYRSFNEGARAVDSFEIKAEFSGLAVDENIAFLPWSDIAGNASLTLQVENKENNRGRYKRALWGGASRSSIFEWELFDTINCVYLPPLRDAEFKLREGKGSRLARLLKNLNRKELGELKKNGEKHDLEKRVAQFNDTLADGSGSSINEANELIKNRLVDALGSTFGQSTHIQFAEVDFSRIVESLRLLFFPEANTPSNKEMFRHLEENSLGYNNLLYLATVLAEFSSLQDGTPEYLKLLLIEEPEAHLHPQLQIKLLKFLESTAKGTGVQVVVTTHSPVLASAVSVDSLIHMSTQSGTPVAVSVKECGLVPKTKDFVSRWADVTKSTLFFARGLILVEGIAEAMVVPELAKIVLREYNDRSSGVKLPPTLEDAGVSVINLNGIYFKHFFQLFSDFENEGSACIPIRCAGLTDRDPPKDSKPTPSAPEAGNNHALGLIDKAKDSEWVRLYAGALKTFEYDMAMEQGDMNLMLGILVDNWPTEGAVKEGLKKLQETEWGQETVQESDKADAAMEVLDRIDDSNMGKGLFAQLLAEKLLIKAVKFSVPSYIENAVQWACGAQTDVC